MMRRQVQCCLRSGAHGVAVLGLATEVNKLTPTEKRQLIDWTLHDVGGQVPVAVTITGDLVEAQQALANYAVDRGADWLILQPPSGQTHQSEAFFFDFFSAVMQGLPVPVGIQNAPEYLGVGLKPDSLLRLAHSNENFKVLKGEASATLIEPVVKLLKDIIPVFNGRSGIELMDNLRAGCAGMIVAQETLDYQVSAFNAFVNGDNATAEQRYGDALPCMTFVMQSLPSFICYGKRIAAWRMGEFEIFDRAPEMLPTSFGLAAARRFVLQLGPLP